VRALKLEIEDVGEGVTFLKYQQLAHGVEVFEGLITVAVGASGEVLSVSTGMVIPDATVVTTPGMPQEEAIGKAFEHAGRPAPSSLQVVEPARTPADTARYTNPLGAERENVLSDLRVMLVGDEPVLAWHSYVDVGPGEWYEMCLDADTGQLLFRHNLYQDAQGTVYTQHPDAGDRIPLFFPASWIDSSTVTAGNNVDAFLDVNDDGVPDPFNSPCMLNGRAYSPAQDFTFPFTPGVDPRTQPCPIVTNLFYFNNAAHDFHYNLGFTEAAGNFQLNNFGRGGLGNDRVLAGAQAVTNNAFFATPPDGTSPHMIMGIFTQFTSDPADDRDSSLDGDIVFHEYGHGVSNRLVGGPSNTSCLGGTQSSALGEGWSDYWAITYYNDGRVGEYSTNNATRGIRRAAYNVPAAAVHDSYADVCASGCQSHNDGEVWAATLWDLRQTLGTSKTNRLVEEGMKYTPCSPSFLNARDGILQADQNLNGGANSCKIWTVFARHGMGSGATGDDGTVHNASSTIPTSCTPAYEGWVDGADCSQIWGWAWDKNNPGTRINVEIYDGSTLIAVASANLFREDLLNAGKGDGRHAFVINTPSSVKNGRWHNITVKPAGSNINLSPGARSITCGASLFSTQTPQTTASGAGATWEQGTRFSSAADGYITQVCFYKAAGESGSHTGHIWSDTGGRLLDVPFFNETASGWQCQSPQSGPFRVTPGTKYWVTYNINNVVAKTFNVFGSPIVKDPLTAWGSAYSTPGGSFPTTGSTSNLFADIKFNSPR